MPEPMVIIGGGLTAASAAETLRAEGVPGPVVVLSDERHLPYLRPPLSKEYLTGRMPREDVFLHDATWYAEQGIDARQGNAVIGLDPALHQVELADGTRLHYDAALVATGSRARTLAVRGAELEGVFTLRRIEDSERIKQVLSQVERIVVVGAGWIGLEIAAAAREAGVEVTVVEPQEGPLWQVLGPKVGQLFADLHTAHGVHLLCGMGVTDFIGPSGQVTAVRLSDNEVLPTDAVIVGVGAVPNVEVVASSRVGTANGIVVDEGLATTAPDVFAAGDVANAFHPRLERRIRVEHWDNAKQQGRTAALAMLGHQVSYDRLPFFYSDQYDVGLEYTGHAPVGTYDRVVLRGSPSEQHYMAFWMLYRRVMAGMTVNIWDSRPQIEHLITSRADVDPNRLADVDIPLEALAPAAT